MKIVYVLVGIVLGIVGSVTWQWFDAFSDGITYEIESLYFPQAKETLYLKKANWGITGGAQIMSISLNDTAYINKHSKSDYILEGLLEVFYRQDQDTLVVYSMGKFKEPLKFNSKVIIKTVEINNIEKINLNQQVERTIKKM